MSVDAKARYAQSHEYARQEADLVVVGISDHAQDELGDIVFIELKEAGKKLEKGQVFGTIESVKAASDLYMPLSGSIAEVNDSLQADPALVNREPYSAGWMIKIKPDNAKDLEALMEAKAYASLVGEE
ncbi:MAG: glycine cleavage system protein GcvH [Spirochaetia bacterium]|jgi:glycine cleavage system H protein|nr:glycine cleavage system protein GcvH [Spirochaetales bacterium]MDX9783731.1 glycine cleavage system protein GcvH [Spirochaetia bacterium]